MTPERWQQVSDLLGAVLMRDAAQRDAFLAEACAGDELLRREVEALLAAHEGQNGLIDEPLHQLAADLLAEDETDELSGQTVGPYRIERELGRGGMGRVYSARDTRLGRRVALKLLPASFTRDAASVRRFEQEARSASALNHPNIVTVFEIAEYDGMRMIATENIDGETLREHSAKRELTLTEVLDIMIQVAAALAAAHEANIVHRDIKPENIMIRRRDRIVKVLDFGLAKLARMRIADCGLRNEEAETLTLSPQNNPQSAICNPQLTAPGVLLGTPAYMSPEQARGLETDARSDIWSLGVVCYELLARRLPFEGATTMDVLAAILHREPPLLSLHRDDVSVELKRAVAKALAKEPEARYQTAEEFQSKLHQLRRQFGAEAELGPVVTKDAAAERQTPARAAPGDQLTVMRRAAQTAGAGGHSTKLSAAYVLSKIRRHRSGALLVLAALLAATIVIARLAYSRYSTESGGANNDAAAGARSIAVLPFANATGDTEAEYLSDGISESLINSLSRLGGVKVIARSSAFKYKNQEIDPQEVSRALGVEAVLLGRVVRRGDRLSIGVELVDARDRTQMWGEQYHRRAEDLLQMEAEIAEEIAGRLRLRLTTSAQRQLAERETANPQAYELVLRGRLHHARGGTENRQKAIEYFQQAVSVDPTYALAYTELSEGYRLLTNNRSFNPQELVAKAEAAARTALALNDGLAEAHYALANLKRHNWEWLPAEREYRRAIELNPNLAVARHGYARHLSFMGQHDAAIAEIRRARELDPLSPAINANVGYTLYFARRYDEALETLQKTLELDPHFPTARFILAATYAAKGLHREAVAAYEEAIKLGGDNSGAQIHLGAAYAQAGERGRAKAVLQQLQASDSYVSPGELALLYGALGEREEAFASLERAYAARDQWLQFLGVEPAFDSLRSDPRFPDLLRRVGLPPSVPSTGGDFK